MSRRLLLPQHRLHPQGFLCTQQNIQISDYQLYAVEKWLVDRSRQLTLLVVYTGDPAHKVTLSAYSPDTTADSETVWDNAIALLRADGAKPKQTNHGVLMVTSLAHFRSDYTIVQIPDGNFLAVKDQLYANINLLRMGCSGRTALTLEDPSETTKERFISTYHLPETTISHSKPLPPSSEHLPLQSTAAQSQPQLQLLNEEPKKQQKSHSPQIGLGRPSINVIPPSASASTWRSAERVPNHSTPALPTRKDNHMLGKTKDRSTFVITVLELVKLVQAGLSIFGLFGSRDAPSTVSPNLVLDGLLCDETVDGIRAWIASVGGPCVGLEPTERIADPAFISGLLSLVLSTRNQIACLGYSHVLPRDPFLYPYAFSLAISAYLQSNSTPTSTQSSPSPSALASSHQLGISQNHFTHPHLSYHAFASPHIGIANLGPGSGGGASGFLIPPAPPPTNIYSATAAAHANAYVYTNASSATSVVAGGATPSPIPAYASPAILPLGAVLNREIVESISSAYEAKQKSESKRVRRVIKNKLGNTAGAGSASGNVNAAGNLGGIDSDGADGEREGKERRNTLSMSSSTGEGAALNSNDRSPPMAGHGHSMSLAGGGGGASGGGIGSSGGQILTGIGTTLASGLGLAGAAAGYSSGIGDPSGLTVATLDLAGFVGAVAVPASDGGHASRKEKKKHKSRERTKSRTESVDIGVGYSAYAYARKEKDKDGLGSRELRDGIVGGSLKALWSGRIVDVVRMREEWDVEGAGKLAGPLQRKEKDKDKSKRHTFGDSVSRAIASDGDGDESYKEGMKRYDGRSTEEESDVLASGGSIRGNHAFGWGGRVRGKLGHWAGLTKRKHQSVDLSATSSLNSSQHGIPGVLSNKSEKEVIPPVPPLPTLPKLIIGGSASAGNSTIGFGSLGSASSRRPNPSRRSTIGAPPLGGGGGPGSSRAQSPTLPPLGYSAEPDDDDLLSSGQASPLSDYRPNPFTLGDDAGGTGSLKLDEQTLSKLLLNPKRPMPPLRRLSQTARISSWADPFSARDLDGEQDDDADDSGPVTHGPRYRARRTRAIYEDAEEESDVSQLGPGPGWKKKEKARFHSLLSVVDGEGQTVEKQMDESEYSDEEDEEDEEQSEQRRRRTAKFDPRRRRSFHDLDAFKDLEVLSPERMKIDVDICGQCLIMWRREEHLRNVVHCVRLLSASLSHSNTGLREHYKSHIEDLDELNYGAQIISEMEEETHRTEKFSQATNTLRYESEQFNVANLWQAASPSRHKVFELREKVFGTGGRKLAPGVNGAHGQFNRLQWTLDDKVRLVDYLGRTEDEEDEESRIGRHGFIPADIGPGEVEDEDVVEHPGIKPMWLLRFFTSWGARWSAATTTKTPNPAGVASAKDEDTNFKSPMSGSEVGSPAMLSPVSDTLSASASAVSSPTLSGQRRRPVPMDIIPGSFN